MVIKLNYYSTTFSNVGQTQEKKINVAPYEENL